MRAVAIFLILTPIFGAWCCAMKRSVSATPEQIEYYRKRSEKDLIEALDKLKHERH